MLKSNPFEDVLDNFVDAIVITDIDGEIIKWNVGARLIFGYDACEVIGENISIIFCDAKEKDEVYSQIISDGSVRNRVVKMKSKINMDLGGLLSLSVFETGGTTKGIINIIKDITQVLKQAEETKRLNRYFENFIEEAPIGIILVDNNERIIRLNKKQEENSRIKREHALGRSIKSVFKNTYKNENVRRAHEALIRCELKQVSILLDHYLPQFYNEEMTFRLQGCSLGKGMGYAIFCEIEKELYGAKRSIEKTGEELRQSQKYLSALLDASPNIVISVDSKHRILSFNKTAEVLLGLPAEDAYNTVVDRFFPEGEIDALHSAISSPTLWYGTLPILRRDKSSFQIELYSTKIIDDKTKKEIATLLIGKDIEETKQLRHSLIQSQKMSFLGEIMGGLAHQINNPLVGIVNIADVVLKKMDPKSELYNYVKMMWEAGNSCKEIVSRLLRFSRKAEKDAYTVLDVWDVLNSTLDIVTMQTPFKEIRIKRDFNKVLPIKGDLVLLQQAFINILWNAAQAMDGKGTIEIGCSVADGINREVIIAIKDKGKGILEENLPRIFEPFFTTKEADKGIGLGLTLSFWIIKDHNGRIEVDSTPGLGSTFKIFLPITRC
ncbi:MAG: PAS domain S-box protein [Thermodesulfobacteriota bacterium]|nr:PAS domain S-box protein [Thermodesulfobacteriota bacterium]